MENKKHFCTCCDHNCPFNPVNHDGGCDPCIEKNLRAGEIPSCFFKKIDEDLSGLKTFTMESFVSFYLEHHKA